MQKSKTQMMILCALFAALTAVLSQIAIPIGPVPINLATFAVFCAGALLGAKFGALSLGVWVALGAVGVPVFSMFRGGLSALVGPTGGYIFGYILAAFLVGLIVEKFNKENKLYWYLIAMAAGIFVCYLFGTIWFIFVSGRGVVDSLMVCVVPFLPGDFIKIVSAAFLVNRLRPVLFKES